jgi:RHS repeat-associated protein
MAYDSNKGGITTKSDAGTMFYNTSGKPYRLSGISPTTGLVPSNTQSISYTSFESVSTISENNYVASFTYNPESQRSKMIVQQSGNTILTRWYSGSSYVKETADGVTKQYTYIGGDAYSAPVVAIKTGTGTPVYYYLLRDYLGSITHVVNTSKTTVAENSYDAWGRMRNHTNWTNYAPGTEPALFVAGRGYTGHEHLPWFNSINMNGRIYDPLIGQFLSPDNYVQSPDFTQNFNRYSYCLNNPLKFTDPSGMLAKEKDEESDAAFEAYWDWLCNRDMGPIGGGSGGGGTSSTWLNTYLNAVHSTFQNGYNITTSQFNYEYNLQINSPSYNGTITFQTGMMDYYTFWSIDGRKTWHQGNYINSEPIYTTIEVISGQGGYKDVTSAFDAQLEKTMAYFSIARDWFDINYPKGGLMKEIDKMMFFRNKVNDNAVFDIKRTAFSRANLGAEYGIYRGQEFRYDDFGNYNYGVASKYFGLTLDRALLGAGINQISKFNPDFGNPGGYFDHRRDTEMIIRGYYHKW